MSKVVAEVLQANEVYVGEFGEKSELRLRPARQFAILTCLDARLDPAKFAGLAEGDAHVIRNAGGRASDDAIRSLVISHKLAGTKEWFVIQHTNCGMELVTNEIMADLLEASLDTATYESGKWKDNGTTPGSSVAREIDFLPIGNLEECVLADVLKIKNHPLVSPHIRIYGYIYDVKTGRLHEVEAAMEAGKPKDASPPE